MNPLTNLPLKLMGLTALPFLVAAAILFGLWKSADGRATKWEAQAGAELTAHRATVDGYREAARRAQERHDTMIRAMEQHWRDTGERTADALAADLDDLRRLAAAGQLRPAFAEAHPGRAGGDKAAADATATCRAADPAWVCVPSSVILRGAENEARHDRLIDYVLGLQTPAPGSAALLPLGPRAGPAAPVPGGTRTPL